MRLRKSAYIVIASMLLAGLLAGCGTTGHTEAGNAGTEAYTDKAALGGTTPYASRATIPAGETTEETTQPVNDDGTASESKETAGIAVNSQETEPFKAAEAADETHEPGSADVRPTGNNPVTEQTKPVQSESKPATVPAPTATQSVEPKPTVAPTQPVTVNPTTTQPKPTEAPKSTVTPTQPTQKPTASPTQSTGTEPEMQSTTEAHNNLYMYDMEAVRMEVISRLQSQGFIYDPNVTKDNSWSDASIITADFSNPKDFDELVDYLVEEAVWQYYDSNLLFGWEPITYFNIILEKDPWYAGYQYVGSYGFFYAY